MGSPLPFSTLEAAELRAGYQYVSGEVMMFVRGSGYNLIGVIDTHLKDGDFFQGFLWLLLEVIMERDWLGREDVDECLDKLFLCLTRHKNNSPERIDRYSKYTTRTPNPLSRPDTLLLASHSYLDRVFATIWL